MSKSLAERIAEKKARIAKEDAALATLVAKAKTEARSQDTRRKIVVGAAMLAAIESDPSLMPVLRKVLVKFVSRDNDRSVVADLLGDSPAPAAGDSAVPEPASNGIPTQ